MINKWDIFKLVQLICCWQFRLLWTKWVRQQRGQLIRLSSYKLRNPCMLKFCSQDYLKKKSLVRNLWIICVQRDSFIRIFSFWLKFWVISILPLWVLLQWSPCNRGSVLHNGTSSAFYNTAAPLFHSTSETEYSHIHNTCRDKRETGEYGVTEWESGTKPEQKTKKRKDSDTQTK